MFPTEASHGGRGGVPLGTMALAGVSPPLQLQLPLSSHSEGELKGTGQKYSKGRVQSRGVEAPLLDNVWAVTLGVRRVWEM